MSLEELKRENEKAEEEAIAEPQAVAETEAEPAAEREAESVESEGSGEAQEATRETVESWMQSDDQESQKTVPLNDLIKMRSKLKGEVSNKSDEIEKLKAEVNALKASKGTQKVASTKPKRDDFLDADDPDGDYLDALSDWKLEQRELAAKKDTTAREQQRLKDDLEQKVENHYKGVQELLNTHNLGADVYQKADARFRGVVDSALSDKFPGQGDAVADMLLTQMGDDSGKLVMYIGNNTGRSEQLKNALQSDPNGMKAMRLFGKWEAEMTAPSKRTSSAPPPSKRADGDQLSAPGADAYRRRYQKAHASGNAQEAFNIRREARSKNIDVSNF